MIKKPKYIKKVESNEILSSIEISVEDKEIQSFLDGRNFLTVWSKGFSTLKENKIIFNEKIYKTKQGFYLYLFSKGTSVLTIYYRQEQLNELTIFLGQLLKQIKNDTTTNK